MGIEDGGEEGRRNRRENIDEFALKVLGLPCGNVQKVNNACESFQLPRCSR